MLDCSHKGYRKMLLRPTLNKSVIFPFPWFLLNNLDHSCFISWIHLCQERQGSKQIHQITAGMEMQTMLAKIITFTARRTWQGCAWWHTLWQCISPCATVGIIGGIFHSSHHVLNSAFSDVICRLLFFFLSPSKELLSAEVTWEQYFM